MDRLLTAALVVYLATLPLIRLELFTLAGKSFVPSDLCFMALVGLATFCRSWRRPSPELIVIAVLPPTATTAVALLGDAPLAAGIPEIARSAYSMATLLAFASLDLGRERERIAIRTWTLTAAAVCLIGLTAFAAVVLFGAPANPLARPNSPPLGPQFIRISGVLETNALTLYLSMAAAFSAYLARFGDSAGDRRLGMAALLLMSVTVLAAVSRGAIGFMLAIALLAWRAELAPRLLSRYRVALALAAGLLFIAGIVATLWTVFPPSPSSRAGYSPDWNRRPNSYRVVHAAGLRMFTANPFHGVGPGSFGSRLAEFTTPEEMMRAWPPLDPRLHWSPHSTWIGFAAEGGLVLLVGWLTAFAWLAGKLLELRKGTPSTSPFLGLSLVGLFVNGFHIDFQHLRFIWAAVGAGLGRHIAASHES